MIEPQARRAIRNTILAQCAGSMGGLVFLNGFMLAYLSQLGIASANILLLLALPSVIRFLLLVPGAFLSDRFGKKPLGTMGLMGNVLGFSLLPFVALLPPAWVGAGAAIGIAASTVGLTLFSSSWFALLSPIVPEHERGRFFGRLRLSWQTFGLAFTLLATAVLRAHASMSAFQALLGVVAFLLFVRILFYVRIPELDRVRGRGRRFGESLIYVLRIPGYFPFCCYLLVLMLFSGACPWLFGLLEKDVLGFGDDQIVLMGNLLFAGSILGYFVGGTMVDRFGTRPVFLFCHLSFGAILFLFLGRGLSPLSMMVTVGFLTACFGFALAASSIAISSELLALIPKEDKSLSTAFSLTLQDAGRSLAAAFSAQAIKLGVLNSSWSLFGQRMSEYDTLILGCAIMVTLLVVTLGLIPSVIRQAQRMP